MIDTKALRSKILDLAIQGKLTEQLPEDGTAEDFFRTFPTQSKKCNPIKTEEQFFDLPINWKWCRFSEVAEFHLGKTPTRGNCDYWEDGFFPWVSIADMTSKNLVRTKEKVSKKAANECFSKGITPKGTMIMSFKLSIGKVSILGVDAFHNEAIISIFPRNDFDNVFRDYLMFVLPYSASHGKIYGAVKGNTLNKDSLSDLLLPLPPLIEQKRIVEKVEQIFSVLDIIDDLQAQYADNRKALKSKLIDAAILGKLTEQLPEDGTAEELYRQIQDEKEKLIQKGKLKKEKPLPEISEEEIPFEIPENWKWVRIGDVFKLQAGKNIETGIIQESMDRDHKYPCYGGNGLRGFVDQSNVDGYHAIIGRQGALCGNINFAEGKFYATEHAVVVYQYAKTNITWAGVVLRALNLNQYATSVAQPGLSVAKVNQVLLPLPPLSEQKRIVSTLNELLPLLE